MFFRRQKPRRISFDERMASLKTAGFTIALESAGRARVTRNGCGAIVESAGDGNMKIGKAGVVMGEEIGMLVFRGYQMFLDAPSGREKPALASDLRALHAFDEDLREGLGLTSLYNLSLGTTSDEHLYDRVEDRDSGTQPHPWEKNSR